MDHVVSSRQNHCTCSDQEPHLNDEGGAVNHAHASNQHSLTTAEFPDNVRPIERQNHRNDIPVAPMASGVVLLHQSSRMKGYLTLLLTSIINYGASQKSSDVALTIGVPASDSQRRYAVAVSVVSLVLSAALVLVHLDRVTPFVKVWKGLFASGSKIEVGLLIFLALWWSFAVGFGTSIGGIAGDGKGQYSLYYSTWGCCLASWWCLERWSVSAGFSSLQAFVTSWPYRAPGWLCMMVLSVFTLIWYIDLWRNHTDLERETELSLRSLFQSVSSGVWQWLVVVVVFTLVPSLIFILVEILRETKPDGSTSSKAKAEIVAEGSCLLVLVLLWIPTIVIATAPGGPASLVGNAYFFSWLLVTFAAETAVWFVHDLREAVHKSLKKSTFDYRAQQRIVLDGTLSLQQQASVDQKEGDSSVST